MSAVRAAQLAARNPGDSWSMWKTTSWSSQVSAKPARGEAFLGLALTSAEELIKGVVVGSSRGCSGHTLAEFRISRIVSWQRETLDPKIWKSELPDI